MGKLKGKVAVITGGNSGIGLTTAQEFLREGARVLITGRNEAAVNEAVNALGEGATGLVSDANRMSDVLSLGEKVAALTGKIDVLFVNAGMGKFAPIEQMSEEVFNEIMNINFKGAYFSIQALLPLMNEGGSIILNTSINAHIGMAGASVYAASKAALLSLIRNLSTELLPRRIRVNAISPGPISTPMWGKSPLPAEQLQAMAGHVQSQIPLGRFGTAEEIAKIALFFASDDSSFVLGAELIADGGMATL
ncbi:MAG: SDR family oxidoreductase [Sphingobacteriaceae bacterium]|nr:SDR family oxidoreductase [Cytophagaceae bacterium]